MLLITGITSPSADTVRRATLFVGLNGFDPVKNSATFTAFRARREEIADRWSYLVATHNRNLSRLSYLYRLFHWLETSLRSSLDAALAEKHGGGWFRTDCYLPRHEIIGLPNDPEQRSVKWRYPAASGGLPFPDYDTPEEFLAHLTLGLLSRVVIYGTQRDPESKQPRLHPIFFGADGRPLEPDFASSSLDYVLRRARNAVAHNRPLRFDSEGRLFVDREAYDQLVARLERILAALKFDVAKAIHNGAFTHVDVVNDGVDRLKRSDLRVQVSRVP